MEYPMITFDLTGTAGLFLKYSGDYLDVARSLPEAVLNPTTQTYLRFTAGITGLASGLVVTGGVSGAIGRVDAVVITAGTLAGSDAVGILFITVRSGTFQTDENLVNGITTYAISRTAIVTLPSNYRYGAKAVVVQCLTGAINLLYDGSPPTNSGEIGDASFGFTLQPTDAEVIRGWENVRRLKFLNAVAVTNGILNVEVFYGGVE